MAKTDLTAQRLRELLDYNPETGVIVRHARIGRTGRVISLPAPVEAGSIGHNGYISLTVGEYRFKAHRLAWILMNGVWPDHDVDHINGVKSDNRWVNLRDVTRSENSQNRRKPNAPNTTRLLGVSRQGGKYRARIDMPGISLYLGRFPTADLAYEAYLAAKRKLHSTCTI